MKVKCVRVLLFIAFLASGWSLARAQALKITPLGSHAGEFCQNDRALLFEDPTGVRILYDAGSTVAGATDARLGDVHVILLSHAHGDHIGIQRQLALTRERVINLKQCLPRPIQTRPRSQSLKILRL